MGGRWLGGEPKLDGWRAIVTIADELELRGPTWCTLPSFAVEDARTARRVQPVGQEGIVLKKLDSPYLPGTRSKAWRKAKTAEWRTTEAPRRLPAEVRTRIEARKPAGSAAG